jgi:nucleoside phosphorylase
MRPELAPVVRVLGLRRRQVGGVEVHTTTLGDVEVFATVTGIGTAAAVRATEQMLGTIAVDHVVVCGIAGGLGPRLAIGDVVVPEGVIDGPTGQEYRPTPLGSRPGSGKLYTSDQLIVDEGDLARLEKEGVVALDMETSAVAATCERLGRPWSVFRGISDRTSDGMLDQAVMGLARPDGSPNLPAVARFLVFKPWRVRDLARLAQGTRRAAGAAANAVADALRGG